MSSKVFTEEMNRTDSSNPERSIDIIDNYIRYMVERIEFSVKGVFKAASAAGSSSAEVMQEVRTLRDTVSVLSSAVSRLQGDMIEAQAAIVLLQDDMVQAQEDIEWLKEHIGE